MPKGQRYIPVEITLRVRGRAWVDGVNADQAWREFESGRYTLDWNTAKAEVIDVEDKGGVETGEPSDG